MARWYATSTQMLDDPKVVRVGEHYGGDTVSVIHGLLRQAMLQENGGEAELTFRNLAHNTFTAADKAREIVMALADTGFLTVESDDEHSVIVRFPAWERHQATFRKAKSRAASKPTDEANVTAGHKKSRPVTESHLQDRTGQDRTTQEKGTSAVPAADAPLSNLLADLCAENDPDGKRPNVGREWAAEEDRMIRLDGRKPNEAERLIRWTQNDSFWRGKVLSMKKFRKQYGQLYLDAVKDTEKQRKRSASPGMDNARRLAERAKQLEAEERVAS